MRAQDLRTLDFDLSNPGLFLPQSGNWFDPASWRNQLLPDADSDVLVASNNVGNAPDIVLEDDVSIDRLEIRSARAPDSFAFGNNVLDLSAEFITAGGRQSINAAGELRIESNISVTNFSTNETEFGNTDVLFRNIDSSAARVRVERDLQNSGGRATFTLDNSTILAAEEFLLRRSGLALQNGSSVAALGQGLDIESDSSLFSNSLNGTGNTVVGAVRNEGFIALANAAGDRIATTLVGPITGAGLIDLGVNHDLVLRQDNPNTAAPSVIEGGIVGPGRLRIQGEHNTVEIRGSNSVSDGLIVEQDATLVVDSSGRLGTLGNNFLQLSSGGTLRATGDLNIGLGVFVNEGEIDTNGSSVTLLSGVTGPTDSVFTKSGAGSLSLGGDNGGYNGDWRVTQGALVTGVTADSFSSMTSVTLGDEGTLLFSDDEGLAGVSGSGQIQTTFGIEIQIGSDNSDYDFSGRLFGPGDIVKSGAGQQRFSGDNSTHTGRWVLNEGSFRFGSGKSLSGDLAIGSGKTIFFDPESGESDYAHSLSGDGTVFMSGSGTINLTGDNSGFTGTLFITHPAQQGGTLNVEGTIAPSVLGIEANATLGGSGDILGTATAISGTIRPAADTGRLRVDGVDFRTGSTFGVDIASASEYSTLRVLGNVAVNDAILNVDLLEGFLPAHGDVFHILDADGAVSGSGFSGFDLPEVPGMEWDISQLLISGLISIEVSLPGDYNLDGTVDAADYTVWRDSLGESAGALPSDIDGGVIGQAQYDTWVAHFGQSLPDPAAAVPEPAALILLACFLAATPAAEQRR